MKIILLCAGMLLASCDAAISQAANEYLLVATYEVKSSGKNSMCRDYALIQEKVSDRTTFENRRKEILQQYPGFSTVVRLINPDQAIIVYEYEKKEATWDCTKKIITIKTGKDLEYCKSVMEKDLAERPKHYYSTPKAIFQRTAVSEKGYYEVLQNWDGIEVKYRFIKSGNPDQFAVIQIKNPLKDKAAIIAAFRKSGINQVNLGKPIHEITLEPGMFGNFSLKPADDYILAVKFDTPGKTGQKERSVIDWIKGYIKSEVTKDYRALPQSTKDSIDKRKSAPTGVRG
ncbi:MAG: hypothetical protein ACK5AO_01560 [bacterium]|jgi:hypothetical protein